MFLRLFAGAAIFLSIMVPTTVWAQERTNRALVVAVSDYPHLPKRYALKGPENDARLVVETLKALDGPARFRPEDITVLGDRVPGAPLPTLGAITAALDDLARNSREGDFVYVHFSGHGSYQPALEPASEPDRRDEVFLPYDVQMRKSEETAYPNGLVDDVIAAKLAAIKAKGAFIWIVFDACNSATAMREGKSTFEANRWVDPLEVGFTKADFAGADAGRADAILDVGENDGGIVAFYAAQTTERTPEMALPGKGDQWYGLFTYTLLSKIATQPSLTFRQVGQGIISTYAGRNRRPTPYFEGELDRPLFLTDEVAAPRQWLIATGEGKITLPAGSVHLLSEGALMAILAKGDDDIGSALGFAEVSSSQALSSRLGTIEHGGKPALRIRDIPPGAYARLVERRQDMMLNLAVTSGERYAAEAGLVRSAVEGVVGDRGKPMNFALTTSAHEADILLAVMDEAELVRHLDLSREADATSGPRVWFLRPLGERETYKEVLPPSIVLAGAIDEAFKDRLASSLLSVYRSIGLARLGTIGEAGMKDVAVTMTVRARKGASLQMETTGLTRVRPGDMVRISAANSGNEPIDVNVLYVDHNYSITHWLAERVHEDDVVEKTLFQQGDEVFGDEQLFVIVTQGGALAEMENLSFLVQQGVRDAAWRGSGSAGDFENAVHALFASPPRGMALQTRAGPSARGMVLLYPIVAEPVN